MRVEVVRAWRDRFDAETLELATGATVADALALTRVPREGIAGFAIHGERATGQTPLRDGDRLELLDPLLADPKESRRRRARDQAQRKTR
ncbi:MAG TPA: RnfH family protein [Luteimonas sp.]|nr:RnfH family protein [Luteimonas sp.]HRO27382.1 RnfH family protein [Luteimonas sp.]HRP73738.1 RnfH family protein [Luteimonas sp.]